MVNNLPAAAGGHAPMMIGNETFSTSYTMIVREVSFFCARSQRRMRYEPRFYRQYPLSCPAAVCGGADLHHQGRRPVCRCRHMDRRGLRYPQIHHRRDRCELCHDDAGDACVHLFRAGGQCGHRHRQRRRLGDGQYRPDHVPVADLHGMHHAAAAVCGQGGAAARGDRGSVRLHARRAAVHP